jgi:hypothetical protein
MGTESEKITGGEGSGSEAGRKWGSEAFGLRGSAGLFAERLGRFCMVKAADDIEGKREKFSRAVPFSGPYR